MVPARPVVSIAHTRWVLVALGLTIGCSPDNWDGGIHARMGWSEENGLRIVEVPRNGPAYEAGLRPNDFIVAIDGEPVARMSMQEAVQRLRGPVGSHVELGIRRRGSTYRIEVERAPYEEPSARSQEQSRQ